MFTALTSRRRPAFVLAALFVCCLPMPAFSDEFQYLPENVRVIASIEVTAGAKTKTFQEFLKMTAGLPFGEAAAKEQQESVDKFTSKIARVTMGVGMPAAPKGEKGSTEEIEIMTAIKAITIDEVKVLRAPASTNKFKKNFAFKEIKHGSVTIYQETYQIQVFKDGKDDKVGKVIEGEAFYLAEGKYVVSSKQLPALKKIIDRTKPAMLSPVMKAGLKEVGTNNFVSVVIDLKNMPEDQKLGVDTMFKQFPAYAGIKDSLNKAQSLTVKMSEPKGKFNLSTTLTCNDKAGAAAIKTGADEALAHMIKKANEEPKQQLPPDFQKYITGARTSLAAIRLSTKGAQVTASMEIEPEVAVQSMTGWFLVIGSSAMSDPATKVENSKAPEKSPQK